MSVVIVGAGPNLGLAVARRFGSEGLAVGLISRTKSMLDLVRALDDDGITAAPAAAEIRGCAALADAIRALAQQLGPVEALEYFAAEVAYARMLHAVLADSGVHVAHTAIAGRIALGGDQAEIAEVLWRQHIERDVFQTRIGIADS